MVAMSALQHAQCWATRIVWRTTVVSITLLSLTGCLVRPHALNKEEVKARVVKDF